MDDKDKSPGELLQERLILKPQNSGIAMSEEETGKAMAFCEPYKDFLDCAKTERRAVRHTVELLEKNGYKPYEPRKKYAAGDKVYITTAARRCSSPPSAQNRWQRA